MAADTPMGGNGNPGQTEKAPAVKAAQAAIKGGEPARAIQVIRTALSRPDAVRTGAWGPLSQIAGELRDTGAALACAINHQQEESSDLNRAYQLAYFLIEHGRDERAIEVIEKIEEKSPREPKLKLRKAVALAHLGRFDEARACHESLVAMTPDAAESWYQMAVFKGVDADSPLLGKLMDARKSVDDSDLRRRGLFEFALGVIHDRADDVDAAFEHFAEGNRLMGADSKYDPATVTKVAADYRAAYTPAAFEVVDEQGRHHSDRPVFVVGPARSGTTLASRLLSAHSDVAGWAELGVLRVAGYAIQGRGPTEVNPTEQALPDGSHSSWRALADFHLQLLSERFGSDGKVVDKAIFLPFRIGMVLCLYDRAPVIWMRRDPRDVGWSIFHRRLFQQDWSWSLEHIGSRLAEIERMEEHFSELVPDRILNVRYEDLAHNPSEKVAEMLAHCRLGREPVEETFHQQDGPVATASTESVREPISTKSIGAWKRYEKHLEPLLEAYRKAGGRESV